MATTAASTFLLVASGFPQPAAADSHLLLLVIAGCRWSLADAGSLQQAAALPLAAPV